MSGLLHPASYAAGVALPAVLFTLGIRWAAGRRVCACRLPAHRSAAALPPATGRAVTDLVEPRPHDHTAASAHSTGRPAAAAATAATAAGPVTHSTPGAAA